ncbi:hypothetical protein INT45_002737 [Circinella minor]|uniref:Uncharacterized protein n=1 Tax=Circinella minor TaxID=1195481 RepID=A0A8H7S195_9FUNG|nr:hypothetical protein INT45_002737 [Circinella minor]
MRMRYFGAHRSALEMLANLLIGVDEQNDPQLPPQLPTFFRHSKKERKNHRRAVRRERRRQPGYVPPLPTIVAYGDGRLRPSMRGYEPTPVEFIKVGVIQIEICGYVQIIAGYRRNVYPYRWCRHCERGIDENGENVLGRVIDRDLNAANNIGRVFTAYINSNGDPNSRPLYLRRPANQNQHIDAQMQEEELVQEEIASDEEEILEGLHEGQGAQAGE